MRKKLFHYASGCRVSAAGEDTGTRILDCDQNLGFFSVNFFFYYTQKKRKMDRSKFQAPPDIPIRVRYHLNDINEF